MSCDDIDVTISTVGLGHSDDEAMDAMVQVTNDILIAQSNGGPIEVTFWVPENDVVDSAIHTIRELREAVPWVTFDGVAQEVVTIKDIAWRTGVSEQLAQSWTQRPDFPRGRWTWVRVVDWLREHRPGLVDEEIETKITWDQVIEIELALAGVVAA